MDEKGSAPLARRPGEAGRRGFLKSALGLCLALPAGGALAGEAFPGLPGADLPRPVARRIGDHFLVEGWVLTGADLRALGIPEPEAAPRRGGRAGGGLAFS